MTVGLLAAKNPVFFPFSGRSAAAMDSDFIWIRRVGRHKFLRPRQRKYFSPPRGPLQNGVYLCEAARRVRTSQARRAAIDSPGVTQFAHTSLFNDTTTGMLLGATSTAVDCNQNEQSNRNERTIDELPYMNSITSVR